MDRIAYPSSNDDEWTYPNNTERLLDMGDVEVSCPFSPLSSEDS